MHLIEQYALASSSTISKPQIFTKYFPLPNINKYITLHTQSKETKSYDLWQEVIDLILPILRKENISIIQIGQKDEKPINGCYHIMGQTSLNQCCYILQNTLAHLGCDSFPVHVCSVFGKKICSIYSNNFIRNVGPYWSKAEDVILLEPDRKEGEKPSFMITGEKSINTIKPEKLAQSICKLLNLDFLYPYKTLQIGKFYQNRVIESDCSNVLNIQQIGLSNIILRLDYNYNLAVMIEQLKRNPCSILTDKAIPINILQELKPHVLEVMVKITDKHNPLFIKELQEAKIKYRMFTELPIKELNKIKLDYIDFTQIITHRGEPVMPEILKDKNLANIYYKCNKNVISNDFYQSKYDLLSKRKFNPNTPEPQPIKNLEFLKELYAESDYCIWLEKV